MLGMSTERPEGVGVAAAPATGVEAVDVLREVLQLQRESTPEIDVDDVLRYAVANPDKEVVDSLGAVSVVCLLYDAYSPDKLIPRRLLNHANFATLAGLRRVVTELDKLRGRT